MLSINVNRACQQKKGFLSSVTIREASAMKKAIAAKPRKTLFTNVAGKIHWYLLDAPLTLRGKCFGVANSWAEAEEAVHKLLATATTAVSQ